MSRDFTLFQFDVDEATVRRVLSSVPGVTPLPSGEGSSRRDEESVEGDEAVSRDGDAASREGDAVITRRDEPSASEGRRENGAERDATETATGSGSAAAGATTDDGPGTRTAWAPTTPWPGAPTGDAAAESEGGLVSRLGAKRLLLAAGAVLGLGLLGVAAVWVRRRRRGGDGGEGSDRARADRDSADRDGVDRAPDEGADGTTADAEARSYPVDPSPVVGMAFLAVGALVVRRLRAAGE